MDDVRAVGAEAATDLGWPRRRLGVAALLAGLLAVLIGGCSSSGSSDSATTTTASCSSEVSALQDDLAGLKSIDVVADGTDAVTSQLDAIDADITSDPLGARFVVGLPV